MTTRSRTSAHHLPAPPNTFIGRERELAEVKRWLGQYRLVTLTGPGGCGKTRLALKIATEMQAEFEDGVWLAKLASLADAGLVPQAVGSALGVREQSGRVLTDLLAEYLSSRQLLLVMDNCEHLVSACAELAETLLSSCPSLRILATSRETLDVAGEAVWVVPPMSLPEPQPWRSPASAESALQAYEQSEAVILFVDRARMVSSSFELNAENGGWVAEICRRLDGMPLAIELAAARLRTLSVRQIAERLNDRFHLLTGGSRTAPLRQQTLAATLDWSYGLLSATEQKTLERLSVFAGGATLVAAEAVCAGEGVAPGEVLDLLSHLADKSLVVVERLESGETRFRLLETIRQYAHERLVQSGEAEVIRCRHAQFFLKLAEQGVRTDSGLYWPEQITKVEQFEIEHDNLRAALAWSLTEAGGRDIGISLAKAMAQFWQMRGYVNEGLGWLQNFLSKNSNGALEARADALYLSGYLHIFSDDIGESAAFFEEALGVYRGLQHASGIAWQLVWLAWVAVAQGDYPRAVALSREALARQHELGDKYGEAVALFPAGEAAYLQGDLAEAAIIYEQSLTLMREIGNFWIAGRRLTRLGQIAYAQHDLLRGKALIMDGMAACLEGGDHSGVAMALAALAGAARAQGKPEWALRLFAAVATLHETTGAPLWFVDRVTYEREVAGIRAQLKEPTFARLWAEGQAMTLEQAIDYALAEPGPPKTEVAVKEQFGGLTYREREVAVLIAQGKPNREIAEVMTVHVRTVETYVTRILNKMGFDSRVQIATWVIEKGLLLPAKD